MHLADASQNISPTAISYVILLDDSQQGQYQLILISIEACLMFLEFVQFGTSCSFLAEHAQMNARYPA